MLITKIPRVNPLPHTLGVWYVGQGYMRCQRCRISLQPSVNNDLVE